MKTEIHYSINFIKLVFIYIIIIFHTRLLDGILNHGYLGVEIFFIISGFFLAHTAENKISFRNFLGRKINKLYPHYLFSLVIMIIVVLLIKEFKNHNYDIIAELFMMQNLICFRGQWINYPCWYLSVLLYGGALLYIIISYCPAVVKRILVAAFILFYCGYTLIFKDGRMEIWDSVGIIYLPLLRGLCDMSIGVILQTVYRAFCAKNIYTHRTACYVIEVTAGVSVLCCLLCPINLDVLSLIFMACFLLAALSNYSLTEMIGSKNILKKWGKIQYPVFLNHAIVITLYRHYFSNSNDSHVSIQLLILLMLVTLYSIATDYLIERLRLIYRKKVI